jgi:hypothetical protein
MVTSGPDGFPDDAELKKRAVELLAQLAAGPRFTGSENESKARRLCSTLLEREGLSVSEREFDFSEFPGRYGAPLIGFLWLITALVTRHVFLRPGGSGPAMAVLWIGLAISVAVGTWLARHGTARFPRMKSRSANLVASRGDPQVWLVAHLDTKSQTLPMIARIVTLMTAAVALGVLALLVALEWLATAAGREPAAPAIIPIVAMIAAIATVPIILCFVSDRSPGALDNASGVIAVILAAGLLRTRPDLGVILTSGEELGLAGARAYAQSAGKWAIALNCDTIDDAGRFLCMGRRTTGGSAASALMRAAARGRVPLRVRGMIPGLLADSIAFADAGWDAVTLSRGNIGTLAHVHTSSDTCERLNGTGIAKAALLLAATVEELT